MIKIETLLIFIGFTSQMIGTPRVISCNLDVRVVSYNTGVRVALMKEFGLLVEGYLFDRLNDGYL